MAEALKPFHNPGLRNVIVTTKQSLEQVIDETTQDTVLRAEFDPQALEKPKSLVTSFKEHRTA